MYWTPAIVGSFILSQKLPYWGKIPGAEGIAGAAALGVGGYSVFKESGTAKYDDGNNSLSRSISVTYSPQITVTNSDANADVKQLVKEALDENFVDFALRIKNLVIGEGRTSFMLNESYR